jgi:signal transduction histidine kinase
MRLVRTHLDVLIAVSLAVVYLGWQVTAQPSGLPDVLVEGLVPDETIALATGVLFLLSLAWRTRWPLVPLALAYPALVLSGRGRPEETPVLLVGVLLASYSVGAWSGGRVALVGALGVGGLAGLGVVRAADIPVAPRDVTWSLVSLVGAWAVGLAARSIRADRGDERVVGDTEWDPDAAAHDAASRDVLVRDLRDLIERSMSTVVLRSRAARAALTREPARAERALIAIEAAGTEALLETQRLTGLLLSPDGAALALPTVGLRELDELAVQVTDAGLPVTTRVEGQPVPLSPELDAVAFRVVQAALLNALDGTADAEAGVVVRYGREELQIEVIDDGVPLEDGDAGQGATGLLAVRDEVAALGGTLDAGPGDERGYWVLARLPYEPDEPFA